MKYFTNNKQNNRKGNYGHVTDIVINFHRLKKS